MCVSNSWVCLEFAILLWLLFEGPCLKVQLLMLDKQARRLKEFQDEQGIGATVFHHPMTDTIQYKTSLGIKSDHEHSEDEDN